jgi:hypothetical protein
MQTRLAVVLFLALVALLPSAYGMGEKKTKSSITFHMETEATDNPKMIFAQQANGRQRFFRRLSDIGTNDIASFSAFPSEVGQDYGLVILLKKHVATRLSALTNANQGRFMIVRVNGRVLDGVLIDKQIDDGRLVIWKGVTLADLNLLDKDFPRAGQEGKKKK